MKRISKLSVAVLGAFLLSTTSCAKMMGRDSGPAEAEKSSASASSSDDFNNAPRSSSLSKVKMEMSQGRVQDLLGAPKTMQRAVTGKMWIPFYYGADRALTTYYYKGKGRVIFATGGGFLGTSDAGVLRVEYDPKEDGFAGD